MNRLSHKDTGIFGAKFKKQRRAVLHHRDKLLVAHPGRVKKDVITEMTDGVNHLASVIDCAVIGAQLDHSQAEGAFLIGFFRSDFTHQTAQILFIEAMSINPTDKAIGIAGCFKINRGCASLKQRTMVVGFMIITVKKH